MTDTTNIKARVLRTKIFVGSTTGGIDYMLNEFLEKKNICPGNLVDMKFFKLGDIYQLIFIYTVLIDD